MSTLQNNNLTILEFVSRVTLQAYLRNPLLLLQIIFCTNYCQTSVCLVDLCDFGQSFTVAIDE